MPDIGSSLRAASMPAIPMILPLEQPRHHRATNTANRMLHLCSPSQDRPFAGMIAPLRHNLKPARPSGQICCMA